MGGWPQRRRPRNHISIQPIGVDLGYRGPVAGHPFERSAAGASAAGGAGSGAANAIAGARIRLLGDHEEPEANDDDEPNGDSLFLYCRFIIHTVLALFFGK